MKLIKIQIEKGIKNFHNAGSITFYAAPEQIIKQEEGLIFMLTHAQARRLEKHFCGGNCHCGSGPARYFGCWPAPAIYVKEEWIKRN